MKLPVAPISRRALNFTVDAPRGTGMNLSWNCTDPAQAEEIIVLRRRCSRPNLMSRSCRACSSTRFVKVVADGLGKRVEEHVAVEGSSDGIGDIVGRGAGGVDYDTRSLSGGMGGGVATVEVVVGEDGGDVNVEVEAEACPEEGLVWGVEEGGVVMVTTVMAGVFPSSVVTRSEMASMVVLMVSREDWRAVNVRRKVASSRVAVVEVGGLPASSRAMLSTESERRSHMLMDD
ncbi:hypothetical protein CBR_g49444 [Chara braunii]|uniref:Uncharacterized protein n=1 Tax=Chara braunii TaxID=69332 RepID=A0A388M535_CHABU|nr:hypothetical protein CBR_g49444 [Chara braunii]|eukprot:GBG89656.1 hypothetical protein CBR_g49444 [Chara braunii]